MGLFEPSADELGRGGASEFGLHPLAVEDALHAHQRPKLERYGDSWFMVLKTVEYVDHEEVIKVGEVMVFVGAHFLVSVRHGEGGNMAHVRKELEARAGATGARAVGGRPHARATGSSTSTSS